MSVHDGKDINSNAEDPPIEDATIDVTINVTNVNEGPTFADDAPATLSVAENTSTDTNIGSPYTATDPEGDTPLTYSLAGTDAASLRHRRYDRPAQDQGRPRPRDRRHLRG